MRWDTRIVIVVGLLCLFSAAWYFRVFRPARLHQGIAIDFSEPPSESIQIPNLPARPARPEPTTPTRPAVAPPQPAPVVVQPPAPQPVRKPAPVIAPPPPAPAPAPAGPRYYTVKSGDSLWRIAEEQLGDPARHEELFELNADALNHDADNLRVGQKLLLPPR